MFVFSSSFPCSSKHTTLQPVLNPGSIAITDFWPSGAANKSCLAFSANTRMASSSALFLVNTLVSVSIEGANNLLYPSLIASSTCSALLLFASKNCLFKISIASSSAGANSSETKSSFSALRIASIR